MFRRFDHEYDPLRRSLLQSNPEAVEANPSAKHIALEQRRENVLRAEVLTTLNPDPIDEVKFLPIMPRTQNPKFTQEMFYFDSTPDTRKPEPGASNPISISPVSDKCYVLPSTPRP